jgi:hypothetical protein
MKTPIHTFLFVAAILCFFAAGFGSFFVGEPWPWHSRLIAIGLFCWALSGEFTS